MTEIDEKPPTGQSPIPDKVPPKKLNPIAKFLGNIGLVGAATVSGIGAGGAITQGSPIEPFKEGFNASRNLVDKVIPKEDKQESEQNITPTTTSPTLEPQGSVGEEAASTEPDLTALNTIFDTFVEDLRQHPAHKILSMPENGIEGYKITIKDTKENMDKTIKFMRSHSESHPTLDEISVGIETVEKKRIYTILGNDISLRVTFKDPSKADESPPPHRSTAEMLTEELNYLYQQWTHQKVKEEDVVTSSDQAIPPTQAVDTEPTATNTPEPTPTPLPTETPLPYVPDLGTNDGGIQEASILPNIDQPAEVQNTQPVSTDSTTPKSDL